MIQFTLSGPEANKPLGLFYAHGSVLDLSSSYQFSTAKTKKQVNLAQRLGLHQLDAASKIRLIFVVVGSFALLLIALTS